MFKVTKVDNTRLDIELRGKLDSENMKAILDELEIKSQGIESGVMLYDVIEFHLPSLGAVGIELSRFPSLLILFKKLKRAAILTDKIWIKKVSELEGLLIPGIEIKAFNRDKKADAEMWLSE